MVTEYTIADVTSSKAVTPNNINNS